METRNDCYIELDNLFVEAEWDDNILTVVNVQLAFPGAPKDTSRWLDITDHLNDNQLEQIAGQILDGLDGPDDGYGDWLHDCRKDDKLTGDL